MECIDRADNIIRRLIILEENKDKQLDYDEYKTKLLTKLKVERDNVENLLDHHTPYRPITYSEESKNIRKRCDDVLYIINSILGVSAQ